MITTSESAISSVEMESADASKPQENAADTMKEEAEDTTQTAASAAAASTTLTASRQQTGSNTNISSSSSYSSSSTSSSSSGIQTSSSIGAPVGDSQSIAAVGQAQQHHKSSICSTSSSMLTNSTSSPTGSSHASILTTSPTNTAQQQHQQSYPMDFNSSNNLADADEQQQRQHEEKDDENEDANTKEVSASQQDDLEAPPQPALLREVTQQPQPHSLGFEADEISTGEGTAMATTTVDLLEPQPGKPSEFEAESQLAPSDLAEAETGAAVLASMSQSASSQLSKGEEGGSCEQMHEGATAVGAHRLERSNSCSQAECVKNSVTSTSSFLIDDESGIAAAAANDNVGVVSSASIKGSSVSLSHDNLAAPKTPSISTTEETPNFDFKKPINQEPPAAKQTDQQARSNVNIKQQPQQQQQQSSSSRFFSSKLNTGSLWSLLSTGSTNSTSMSEQQQPQPPADESIRSSNDSYRDTDNNADDQQQQQQLTSSMSTSAMSTATTSLATTTSNFLSRYQFKKPTVSAASFDHGSHRSAAGAAPAAVQSVQPESQQLDRRRFRFNVKYIGSALLHRNFTLPMLEWIAKDIRRQTVRGAQGAGQRQFTIATREIIFEIQPTGQLRAISCKDGHCKFVHPMACVSKYVQLQHDPTSFAYIIRDTKESQNFCHVFQAKSANKVHDIFSAIREIAKSSGHQSSLQQQVGLLASNRLQKSASSDGHWKSLLSSQGDTNQMPRQLATPSITTAAAAPKTSMPPVLNGSSTPSTPSVGLSAVGFPAAAAIMKSSSCGSASSSGSKQHTITTTTASSSAMSTRNSSMVGSNKPGPEAAIQFENSYQFEVMFVKRVKLQCRRVPASFVDDALETLRSFEVLKADSKSSQIKGVVGSKSRIINASVDERQEYDESCQSPTTSAAATQSLAGKRTPSSLTPADEQRRGSSASLNRQQASKDPHSDGGDGQRESKSCQQSPTKSGVDCASPEHVVVADKQQQPNHYQSVDCLKSLDETIRTLKSGQTGPPPTYMNDFSPYNTITSTDLNERIAAIPVVSSSVSLDHETRQKLARQVRETIQATAANIKKGVFASGDKLHSTTSSKALDSLSCNATTTTTTSSSMSLVDHLPLQQPQESRPSSEYVISDSVSIQEATTQHQDRLQEKAQPRRSSAEDPNSSLAARQQSSSSSPQGVSNNFDLFRRASARQVVKNRTMLLLIGKDELCAISIDKHQMLFSKSFNSIVHCLQGNNNRDHFGLICRDSGKVNPMTESYVGFVFKCQSDKVVREIMAALKQVIYSSQHNYHGHNSPYNPLNTNSSAIVVATTSAANKFEPNNPNKSGTSQSLARHKQQPTGATTTTTSVSSGSHLSLAAKRGFSSEPLNLTLQSDTSSAPAQSHQSLVSNVAPPPAPQPPPSPPLQPPAPPTTAPILSMSTSSFSSATPLLAINSNQQANSAKVKNPIKSMFCDNCPLYWYHRLCCDVESMPAETSKGIILRRIETSLSDKEQDEVYSKFSEYNIESIEEHNEIFMSILRHLNERKQLKHNSNQSHQAAIAKNNLMLARQNSSTSSTSASFTSFDDTSRPPAGQLPRQTSNAAAPAFASASWTGESGQHQSRSSGRNAGAASHQRSGSTSGSLGFVLGQTNSAAQANAQAAGQSLADASSVAIDNLKRAKNSISVSIENMLKRRSSMKDELKDLTDEAQSSGGQQASMLSTNAGTANPPVRSGSFKSHSRESRANESNSTGSSSLANSGGDSNNLKRSQSTSDYSHQNVVNQFRMPASWRDSLTRTINETDLSNPLANLFGRRRGSLKTGDQPDDGTHYNQSSKASSSRASSENLAASTAADRLDSSVARQQATGSLSPSSMLPGVFWKKSIFDKIKQPLTPTGDRTSPLSPPPPSPSENKSDNSNTIEGSPKPVEAAPQQAEPKRRTRDELRSLWRKAIREQITLLKMDKQNQKLLANSNVECNVIQLVKLNYRDVLFGRDAIALWDRLLRQDPTKKVDFTEVSRMVRLGLPKQRRGEVWMFLMNQYQLRHGTSFQPADSEYRGDANQTYRSLLSQLSTQQHEIFVDIGRTFPSHPYYSQYLSIGQLSLFNLLKAYSLLDQEVGYCQGLSFVAGILLLHVDTEDEAFELMRHLLFNFGLRKQYLPSMNALHLQLYQITRLLRDHEYDVFNHFDQQDISPSLYAAPWFLTLFASQFPLGFVARLLDLIFLIGIEAIFRVSLTLLAYHKTSLLNCSNLEATMEFIRTNLTKIDDKNLAKLFDKAMTLDLRNKLIEYEIEYSFYCAEDKARTGNNQYNQHHHHHHQHHHHQQISSSKSTSSSSNNTIITKDEQLPDSSSSTNDDPNKGHHTMSTNTDDSTTSEVADATATVIIQHLLANNHLRSLRTNYSY